MGKNIDEILNDFIRIINNDTEDEEELKQNIEEVFGYYSIRVSEALNPVNTISLPFIYKTINAYAEQIEKYFPEAVKIAQGFDDMESIAIIIPREE